MTESEIQKDICKMLLKSPDIAFYTVNTTGKVIYRKFYITIGKWINGDKNSNDGLSDITGMTKTGQYYAIEVKVPGKEPTEDQWRFINYVADNGGLSGYATSVEDAESIIRSYSIGI